MFLFDQSKSMIEILELHENDEWKDRVEIFKGWYKYSGKGGSLAIRTRVGIEEVPRDHRARL